MVHVINNGTILENIQRLLPTDMDINIDQVRIRRTPNIDLIFYEDFEKMSSNDLTKVILEYNLDPDRIGVIIDEVKVFNNPHILYKARRVINPNKIYIRPISTARATKRITEAIDDFIESNNWDLFDQYINESEHENIDKIKDNLVDNLIDNVKSGAQEGWKEAKSDIKKDVKKWGIRAAKVGAGMYLANKALNHITYHIARKDALKPEGQRSKLIATLRVLRGKLPSYEHQLQRTQREDYQKRNILGKIIYKIKEAIKSILRKLGLRKQTEDI